MNISKMITVTTEDYLKRNMNNFPLEMECAEELLTLINNYIKLQNFSCPKGEKKLRLLSYLPLSCIAALISARDDIALVASGDKSQSGKNIYISNEQRCKLPLAIYQKHGPNKGVWEISNNPLGAFGMLVELYEPTATCNVKKEVFTLVKSRLRIISKCMIPYYVAVNNGVMDVLHKQLLPFNQNLVFTAKIRTNMNFLATNPHIPIDEDNSTWDVDSWLNSLGNPEFVEGIKEVIQAACLPLAPRDKMCLFYNKSGNNGKGTICQLIRNLLGEESTVSIPLKDFSTRFGLSGLPNAMAVITDENDVSSFNKGNAVLKAVITGDKITIEQKYQDSYDYSFNGLILQCVNDFPNGDDKTGSFKRRLHIITFKHCFTGVQKRYIKDRLIYREDVLEYILKTVLYDMPYRDSFTETESTRTALKLYTLNTNSVVAFLGEVLPECRWDLLPATDFLYEAYKGWYKKNVPSGKVIGRNDFIDELKDYVSTNTDPAFEWEWTDSTRSSGYIDPRIPEPLLIQYNITSFYGNMNYRLGYANVVKSKYSGLKRRKFVSATQGTIQTKEQEDV